MLTIDAVNPKEVQEKLMQCDNCQAIIFTSQNAVKAFSNSKEDITHFDQWRHKIYFGVGQETCALIQSLFPEIETVIGKECGTARELGLTICDYFREQTEQINLLFLCGNLRRNELLEVLQQESKYRIQELVIYSTKTRDEENDELKNLIQEKKPQWLIFFSPSGVDEVMAQIRGWWTPQMDFRYAAIGPTTAECVKKVFGKVDAVAAKPNASSLLQAIQNSV